MKIPFTKASACGNDFLIIDGAQATEDIGNLSRKLCDRHNGVGADGVEWLYQDGGDPRIRLINADGSEAEISGNGTRCVAAYLAAQGRTGKMRIVTGAGPKDCELLSHTGNTFEFEADMGKPEFGEPFSVRLKSSVVEGMPVSMGNPHFVVLVRHFPTAWQQQAAEVQMQRTFKEGVNVEYVRLNGANTVEIRLFERGVGETQSSGTGSCACAVAVIAARKAGSPVTVQAPGGTQVVRWNGENVFLRGPAQLICDGEFFV